MDLKRAIEKSQFKAAALVKKLKINKDSNELMLIRELMINNNMPEVVEQLRVFGDRYYNQYNLGESSDESMEMD